MDQGVIDLNAAIPIHIGEIVNPSTFWGYITEDGINKSADQRQLAEIERQMTNMFQRAKTPVLSRPYIGCLVAVEEPETKVWLRGKIVELALDKGVNVAKVFLLDYGRHLSSLKELHILPDWALYLWPQAVQFNLYGVLPSLMAFNEKKNKFSLEVSSDWMPAALTMVKLDFAKCSGAVFLKQKDWNQQMLGDVCLVQPGSLKANSLTKMLTASQLAVYAPGQYEAEFPERVGNLALNLRDGFHESPPIETPKSVYPEEKSTILRQMRLDQEKVAQEQEVCNQMRFAQTSGVCPSISFAPAGAQNFHLSPVIQQTGNPPLPSLLQSNSVEARFPKFIKAVQNLPVTAAAGTNFWSSVTNKKPAGYPNLKEEANQMFSQFAQLKTVEEETNDEAIEGADQPTTFVNYMLDFQKNPSLPVLLQGYNIEKPLAALAAAPFHTDVHRMLEKGGFSSLTNIQRYMWPAVARGRNVVVVGGGDSGKSMGYFAPLASRHLDTSLMKERKHCVGPITLIVCASAMKAESAEANLKSLLVSNKPMTNNRHMSNRPKMDRVKILLATGSTDDRQKAMELLNGCHILITTPPCFKRLLDVWPGMVTDFKRLTAVVFDDADILFDKYSAQVAEITSMLNDELASRESEADKNIQYIVASRQWSHLMEEFVLSSLLQPVAMLSTGLEILAYAKNFPTLHSITADSRPSKTLEIIQLYEAGTHKVIVFCSTNEEADSLQDALVKSYPSVLLASTSVDQPKLIRAINKWEEGPNNGITSILVVSDETFSSVAASDAFVLINYSLPASKYKFNYRLAAIMGKMPNKFDKCQDSAPKPDVHILVDVEKDSKQINTLVEFLQRNEAPIPSSVLEKSKVLNKIKDMARSDAPLCPDICSFGQCSNKALCAGRHVLNPLDFPAAYLPRAGDITMSITQVHDATHFSARIKEHTDIDGVVKSFSSKEAVNLAMDLSEHFSEDEKRTCNIGNVIIGSVCAVQASPDVFQRVKILQVLAQDKKGGVTDVQVKSLDEGWRGTFKASEMLFLPKNLRDVKPQALDVYLTGLKPKDNDKEWGLVITKMIRDWITDLGNMRDQGYLLRGKVVLTLADSVWLNPILCCQQLPAKNTFIQIYSFGARLLNNKLALANPEHLQNLKLLCDEANIQLPTPKFDFSNVKPTSKEAVETLEADWAFLNSDEHSNVYISQAVSPSSFFVGNAKFLDLLDMLLNDISNFENRQPKNAWKAVPEDIGTFVLAKYLCNETWNRAQIREIDSSSGEILCYFLDIGACEKVEARNVLPMTQDLLKRLPCQAIECSLYGIKPKDSDFWSQSAVSAFSEVIGPVESSSSTNLIAKVYGKKKSLTTGGWQYFVKLFKIDGKIDVCEHLVEKGVASLEGLSNSDLIKDDFWQILQQTNLASNKDHVSQLIDEDETNLTSYQTANPEQVDIEERPCVPDTKAGIDESINWDEIEMDDAEILLEVCGFKDKIEKLKTLMQTKDQNIQQEIPESNYSPEEEVKRPDENLNEANKDFKPIASIPMNQPKMPVLISTCYDTSLIWSQTKDFITIKIQLIGVKDYYLTIAPGYADFATRCQGKAYCVNINLFGYIIPNKSSYNARGLYMEIKLFKALDIMWPRLDNPDCGITGASHTIEKAVVKGLGYSSSDDEDDEILCKKWLDVNRDGNCRITPDTVIQHDHILDADSDEDDVKALFSTEDIYNPLP